MSLTVKRPQTTVEFCTDLGLKADHERAEKAYDVARSSQKTMASEAVTEAAKAVRDLEAQMTASTVVFTLEALPRKIWVELEESHPKRPDNEQDETFGVDVSKFVDAVMAQSVVSVTRKDNGEAVAFKAEKEWPGLADDMTEAQWNIFAITMFNLNRGVTSAPFSPAASRESQD